MAGILMRMSSDFERMLESCKTGNENKIARQSAVRVKRTKDSSLPLELLLLWIKLPNFFVLFRSYNDCGNLFSLA